MGWPALLLAVATTLAAMRAAVERGDLDEAARMGANAGPTVVERALLSRDRSTQLGGIAAAARVEDRAELLGALAQLARGTDRKTAIAAAEAARTIARELARRGRPDDLAPDDLAAWRTAWAELAMRGDRPIEVRVGALDTAAALDPAGIGADLPAVLRDADPGVRRAAIAAVRLPVPAAAQPAIAGAVVHDAEPLVALEAAQALCLSLEAMPRPRPVLDALGPPGLARIRALVTAPPPDAAAPVRDAARCLTADGSPESAAALRAMRKAPPRKRR